MPRQTRAAAPGRIRAVVPCVLLLAACAGTAAGAPGARHEPLAWLELVTGGASRTEPLPFVLALHGRGDTAARFRRVFAGFPTKARIVLLCAPMREGDGDAWFTFRSEDTWRHVAEDLDLLSDRVVATAAAVRARRPVRGLPVVTGFSQGAMIAYRLAVRHPAALRGVVPVSGVFVAEGLASYPRAGATVPRIIALHGRRDPIIPLEADRASLRPLERAGLHVELREHDATHWIDAATRRDLHAQLAALLAEQLPAQ